MVAAVRGGCERTPLLTERGAMESGKLGRAQNIALVSLVTEIPPFRRKIFPPALADQHDYSPIDSHGTRILAHLSTRAIKCPHFISGFRFEGNDRGLGECSFRHSPEYVRRIDRTGGLCYKPGIIGAAPSAGIGASAGTEDGSAGGRPSGGKSALGAGATSRRDSMGSAFGLGFTGTK